MRGYNCYEEIEIHRTTDRVCSEAGGNRRAGGGSLSQDGHLGSDVFQLEAKVLRGLGTSGLRRLRQLEDENARLNKWSPI